jgi:inorganic pyrophosphatase
MDIKKLTTGKNVPEEINVFIEIPQGSSIKYELDKESGVIFVDRFNYGAMGFPANYGFIPNTLGDDGDPLDVLVLASQSVQSGTVIPARPVGLLEMEDEAGVDTKIIAVPTAKVDPFFAKATDIADIDEAVKNKIKNFFDHYKDLEPGKWVKTKNFLGRKEALKAIKKSLK